MSFKISGVIIAALPEISGTSKAGKAWRKREYVLETPGKYPKKIAFSVMNDRIDQLEIALGQTVELDIDIDSREFNGKWFTSVTAWGKTAAPAQAVLTAPAQKPAAPAPIPGAQMYAYGQAAPPLPAGDASDLPF